MEEILKKQNEEISEVFGGVAVAVKIGNGRHIFNLRRRVTYPLAFVLVTKTRT